ncbi:MAG: type II toxin-antitoxin system RelE/ParE family toxin [Flavobacteriaceae bacterium]|nr:type II toxin-antitoxin system RelE/ParE family toxin [Flavobacteriaceae bacterium]
MAKKVIWSDRAKFELYDLLEYWIQRNKSEEYSIKLNGLFDEAVEQIRNYPESGKFSSDKNSRIKIVRDYLLLYENNETEILILTIWDSRQDPDSLKI